MIKADLRRKQKDIYDQIARFLTIPDGKVVYVHKRSPSHLSGRATRFIRHFDSSYLVTGHSYQRSDHSSGEMLSHPINIEKVLVIPEQDTHDLWPPNDAIVEAGEERTTCHFNKSTVTCEFGIASISL